MLWRFPERKRDSLVQTPMSCFRPILEISSRVGLVEDAGFLFALVLGAIGFAIGAHRDGTVDLGALLRSRGRG